jgi:hypothetical protein
MISTAYMKILAGSVAGVENGVAYGPLKGLAGARSPSWGKRGGAGGGCEKSPLARGFATEFQNLARRPRGRSADREVIVGATTAVTAFAGLAPMRD